VMSPVNLPPIEDESAIDELEPPAHLTLGNLLEQELAPAEPDELVD
jgi:hypothetical protein